jgi:hypothetical protein
MEPIIDRRFQDKYQNVRWIDLTVQIRSQRYEQRSLGRVDIDPNSQYPSFRDGMRNIDWQWRLLPEELELIERERSDAKASPLGFNVTARGVLQVDQLVYLVTGEGSLTVAWSDWESYLANLGYNLPPSIGELAGRAMMDHPMWKKATELLTPARALLRAGEGRPAMTSSLQQFEAVVTHPYNESSWRGRYAVPDQKEDGLVAMLAGHCKYLNKVGYHRSRQQRDEQGGLIEMPVDQWEAELAVGASQFWLAYALRLAMNPIEVK